LLVVIIYPDKLEITNTGASPYKQSELKKNHLSMPFNPDIAHMAFLRGYM
jgi:ATP-dependent DNA helicase RecG